MSEGRGLGSDFYAERLCKMLDNLGCAVLAVAIAIVCLAMATCGLNMGAGAP